MGVLNAFGSHAGSLTPEGVVLPILIPAGNDVLLTDFSATMRSGATDGVFSLQTSDDNFVTTVRERERIEMPVAGTFLKSFHMSGISVRAGQSLRVVFFQGVIGPVSVTLWGGTRLGDIIRSFP